MCGWRCIVPLSEDGYLEECIFFYAFIFNNDFLISFIKWQLFPMHYWPIGYLIYVHLRTPNLEHKIPKGCGSHVYVATIYWLLGITEKMDFTQLTDGIIQSLKVVDEVAGGIGLL